MTAYRVSVNQFLKTEHVKDDGTDWEDESFVSYVSTLEMVSDILNRFKDVESEDDRRLVSISIETIHIQTER